MLVESGHPGVHRPNVSDHSIGGCGVAVGRHDNKLGGSLEATERIFVDVGMVTKQFHGADVKRLHKQRSEATDQRRLVTVYSPDN